LTHRLLVTHRLLLHCMKKPSILKVRKILYVIVFRKMNSEVGPRGLPPDTAPQLLDMTAAFRVLVARATMAFDQGRADPAALNDFIAKSSRC
jgi:hypothetical protein